MSNLKKQAVSGVLWTTVRTLLVALFGALLLLVKARYLSPAEFGVMAIINIFISLFRVIENFGVSTAVIQKDNVTNNEQSSLFYLQLLISITIGVFIIGLTPFFVDFFEMPPLQTLLPLLSIIVLFNGPIVLFTSFLEKHFHFKELSIIQSIREGALFAFTSLLLMLGWGLTAVVVGQIISVIILTILILIISYKKGLLHVRLHFKLSEVKPFIKFGSYIAGRQILTQITHHLDEVIIGYFLSAEILGLYYFAKNILNRLRSLIVTSFAKVLYPLMAKVKNDINKLTRVYNMISKYIGVFAFPIFVGIALTPHLFIPVLFGNEWLESVPFFIILAVAYIPYIITVNISSSLLYSLDKPNLVLYTDIFVSAIYIALLLLFSWLELSIYLIVGLYAVYLFGKGVILLILTLKRLNDSLMDYLILFKQTIIATIIMSLSVLLSQFLMPSIQFALIELIISMIVGIAVYFIVYILLDKQTLIEMKNLVLKK